MSLLFSFIKDLFPQTLVTKSSLIIFNDSKRLLLMI